MKYNKRVLKKIYKLRQENNTTQELARKIKAIFQNLPITTENLQKDIKKIFGPKVASAKYTKYEINVLIRLYQSNATVENIIKYFKNRFNNILTPSSLRILMSEHKIKRIKRTRVPRIKVSQEDEKTIIKKYIAGKSSEYLAKEYGFKTSKSILDILKQYNIKRRTRSEYTTYCDLSFEKIDNNFKAYLIGFLITDGYIIKETEGFALQIGDKDAIDFFANKLNLKVLKIKKKNPNCIPLYRIVIFGKERVEQLKRFGIIPRKSLVTPGLNLLEEENKYIPYVLRGMIDGDGWIRKDGKEFFLSTASKKLAEWSLRAFKEIGMEDLKIKYASNNWSGIYYIRSGKQENIKILKEKIYDIPYGMERKYKKLHY